MTDETAWTAAKEDALKALIRQTIRDMGETDPSVLPHRVKERLKSRVSGALDIEAYVRQVLAEQQKGR